MSSGRGMRSCGLTLAAFGFALLAGCGPRRPAAPPPLDTEEVPAPPDVHVDPDRDVKAVHHAAPALSGVLPGDFPAELPLPLGATVSGLGAAGTRTIELMVPRSLAAVRSAWLGRLHAASWRTERGRRGRGAGAAPGWRPDRGPDEGGRTEHAGRARVLSRWSDRCAARRAWPPRRRPGDPEGEHRRLRARPRGGGRRAPSARARCG